MNFKDQQFPLRAASCAALIALAAAPSGSISAQQTISKPVPAMPVPTTPAPPPAVTTPVPAVDPSQDAFQSYLQALWPKAEAMGVSRRTFDAVVPGLSYHARVIELDRSQLGAAQRPQSAPSLFAPYRNRQLAGDRLPKGREVYQRLRPMLAKVERDTGVPEAVMVGIYGHETSYGRVLGSFDLPRSLATLAFEGRRRTLFEPEFLATLKLIDQGIPRERLVGSWAGAFGKPQFLPTVYLRLALDGDGDGRAEIWSSEADAVASIGNYLKNAGWRTGQPWGFAVSVPASLDRASIRSRITPAKCRRVLSQHSRWLTMAEWRARGIVPANGAWPDDQMMATLLEPDGEGQTAYLLTQNFRAILDYNCSNFYGITVGLIADAVSQ